MLCEKMLPSPGVSTKRIPSKERSEASSTSTSDTCFSFSGFPFSVTNSGSRSIAISSTSPESRRTTARSSGP